MASCLRSVVRMVMAIGRQLRLCVPQSKMKLRWLLKQLNCRGTIKMNDYWLSQAASLEAELDSLKVSYEEMRRIYTEKIENLERQLLEANLNAQTRGITSENIQ